MRLRKRIYDIVTAAAIIFIAVMVILGIDVLIQKSRFKSMMFDLGYSVAYSEERGGAVVSTDGGSTLRLDPFNMDRIYDQLLTAGYAARGMELPEDEGITVSFGNDTVLRLFRDEESGNVYLDYKGSSRSGSYRLGKNANFDDYLRLCSPEGTGHPNHPIGPREADQ